MQIQLNDEQKVLRDEVRRFAEEVVKPKAKEIDESLRGDGGEVIDGLVAARPRSSKRPRRSHPKGANHAKLYCCGSGGT